MDSISSESNADLRAPEFQVVIIVDYDDGRLFPLTESSPKCLLPIANRRLLAYQLDMVSKSGAEETFIVSPAEYESQLTSFLSEYVRGKMLLELVIVKDFVGSLDALRAVQDRIRGDFFCINADFISQFSLIDMANLHRINISDVTMMFTVPQKDTIKDDVDQEYVGISEEGRVLMKKPALEVDEMLDIPKPLLRKASNFTLRNDLLDMGVYLLSHWLLEFIVEETKMSSIRTDLLPYLIQRQFQSKEYLFNALPSIEHRKRPLKVAEPWLTAGSKRYSSDTRYQSIFDSKDEDNIDMLRCFGLIYDFALLSTNNSNNPNPSSIILNRLTNIQSYQNLNKEIPQMHFHSRSPWSRVANYMKKEMSVIGETSELSEMVTVKLCSIGSNCKIGQKAKLNNCVIMDNVTIGDNCIIQNSVICDRAIIENNCNINECTIGAAYKVTIGSKIQKETLA